jgi:hypothetical protein
MSKCYVGLEMHINPNSAKLVVGHREPGDRIVVDYFATSFTGVVPDDSAQWVVDQLREANITSEVDVAIDQWDTATLAAALRARGLDVRTMHSSAVVAVIHNLGKMIDDEMVVASPLMGNTPAMFGVEYAFGLMVLAAQSDSPEEPVVPPTPATLGDVWALYQRLSADDQVLFQVLAKAYVRHTDGGVSLVGLTDNDFSELLAGRLKP